MDRLTSNKKGISFKPILEIIGFLRYFMKKSQMDWMTGQRHVPRERESWRKLILFTLSGKSIHSEGKVYKFFLNLAGKVYTFPSDKKRITFLCGKLGKVNKFLIFHIRIYIPSWYWLIRIHFFLILQSFVNPPVRMCRCCILLECIIFLCGKRGIYRLSRVFHMRILFSFYQREGYILFLLSLK